MQQANWQSSGRAHSFAIAHGTEQSAPLKPRGQVQVPVATSQYPFPEQLLGHVAAQTPPTQESEQQFAFLVHRPPAGRRGCSAWALPAAPNVATPASSPPNARRLLAALLQTFVSVSNVRPSIADLHECRYRDPRFRTMLPDPHRGAPMIAR